jgi:hypothetical protein
MFRKMLGILTGVGIWAMLAGATDVSGPVSGTWTAANNPYNVIGEINVPTGQTLNIQPGVQVIFQGHYKFIVNSRATLRALGTQQDTILFTAINPQEGWRGIRFLSSSDSCLIEYCHITKGRASGIAPDCDGAGIYCDDCSPVIKHCLIENCRANQLGGAIACKETDSVEISDNLIMNNFALWGGGGIAFFDNSTAFITNNIIMDDTTDYYGGGIYVYNDCNGLVENNLIQNNRANYGGGGINCSINSGILAKNNLVFNNSAQHYGGGLFIEPLPQGVSPTFINNNIISNYTDFSYQGIYALNTPAIMKNCIIWENGISGTVLISYSCIQNGYPGSGNIDSDPLFVSGPDGNFYLSQLAAGQTQQSPCLDAGHPASSMIEGTTRTDSVQDVGIVDMGYHYFPAIPPPPPPPSPPVSVTLTPVNPPIVIPASGGAFLFDALLQVNADTAVSFHAWIMQITPTWAWQGPMLGPVPLWLPEQAIIGRQRVQNVPSIAPPGTYTYIGYVGIYPSVKWDSSYFQYTKLTTGDGPLVNDWLCSGDPFPGERSMTASIPSGLTLGASPNPFNPYTSIRFDLPQASWVQLEVFDTAGRMVSGSGATPTMEWYPAGSHEVTFDGSNLPSGVYLVRLTAGEFTAVQKMVLLK